VFEISRQAVDLEAAVGIPCSASTTSRSAASLTCGSAKAGEPRATLRFDETIAGQAAFQPVQRGALTGISIGNRILTWREIDPDNFLATH
jgi:hypothetical protein